MIGASTRGRMKLEDAPDCTSPSSNASGPLVIPVDQNSWSPCLLHPYLCETPRIRL